MVYYNKEEVDKFLQAQGIILKFGDLKEYWSPVLHINVNQAYATGPCNIIPTIYFNNNNIFSKYSS